MLLNKIFFLVYLCRRILIFFAKVTLTIIYLIDLVQIQRSLGDLFVHRKGLELAGDEEFCSEPGVGPDGRRWGKHCQSPSPW